MYKILQNSIYCTYIIFIYLFIQHFIKSKALFLVSVEKSCIIYLFTEWNYTQHLYGRDTALALEQQGCGNSDSRDIYIYIFFLTAEEQSFPQNERFS